MRSSWNFSTAILEIWVLVLTKPGWANETPTTSLKVPRDSESPRHHVQHQQYHHHHPHYSVAESIPSSEEFSGRTKNSNNLFHSSSSLYYTSSNSNNNHHHQHHYLPHHHHHQQYRDNIHHHHLESASRTIKAEEPLALASSSFYSSLSYPSHRCYVCLPPNKNSREAQQILDIFAVELRPLIPDCKDFDPYVDAGRFEFECPPKYGGCLLRIHGANVSRACSRYRVNDCKKANSVEFCYCTTSLCNDQKPAPIIPPSVVQHVSRNVGQRRGSNSSGNKSSLRGRTTNDGNDDIENSQRIRSRISASSSLDDDDNVLHTHDDDDEDNGGSGGSSLEEEHNHPHHNIHSFTDPSFTSTMDPSLFQEESNDVEDPNPHTKIGISMTASTSSSGAGGSSTIFKGSSCFKGNFVHCSWSVFHLFLYLVQRTLLPNRLSSSEEEQEQLVHCHRQIEPLPQIFLEIGDSSANSSDMLSTISCERAESHSPNRLDNRKHEVCEVIKALGQHNLYHALFHSNELCFIISLLLLFQVLLS